jgi:hypothetical protein
MPEKYSNIPSDKLAQPYPYVNPFGQDDDDLKVGPRGQDGGHFVSEDPLPTITRHDMGGQGGFAPPDNRDKARWEDWARELRRLQNGGTPDERPLGPFQHGQRVCIKKNLVPYLIDQDILGKLRESYFPSSLPDDLFCGWLDLRENAPKPFGTVYLFLDKIGIILNSNDSTFLEEPTTYYDPQPGSQTQPQQQQQKTSPSDGSKPLYYAFYPPPANWKDWEKVPIQDYCLNIGPTHDLEKIQDTVSRLSSIAPGLEIAQTSIADSPFLSRDIRPDLTRRLSTQLNLFPLLTKKDREHVEKHLKKDLEDAFEPFKPYANIDFQFAIPQDPELSESGPTVIITGSGSSDLASQEVLEEVLRNIEDLDWSALSIKDYLKSRIDRLEAVKQRGISQRGITYENIRKKLPDLIGSDLLHFLYEHYDDIELSKKLDKWGRYTTLFRRLLPGGRGGSMFVDINNPTKVLYDPGTRIYWAWENDKTNHGDDEPKVELITSGIYLVDKTRPLSIEGLSLYLDDFMKDIS